jgi:hypothetical protein
VANPAQANITTANTNGPSKPTSQGARRVDQAGFLITTGMVVIINP